MSDPGREITTRILCEPYAGLRSQGLGLAEAAGVCAEVVSLAPRLPWSLVPARLWPDPLGAVRLPRPWPALGIGVGGVGAAVIAALRRRGVPVVQVQHPRMRLDRFDFIVVARHDGISGPNVFVTRTALHRVTPERLAAAAAQWRPRLAHLRRPLVAVLLGGTNGRYIFGRSEACALGEGVLGMMRHDRVGLAVTPSRRTDPEAMVALTRALAPAGAYVWSGEGENPYFGLLALADAIIVTIDSVSMISEAVATEAPVMLAPLPGRSRRGRIFVETLTRCGRVRPFSGRFQEWRVAPLNDTAEAAMAMRHRLGFD